jgi:hypothetical protein
MTLLLPGAPLGGGTGLTYVEKDKEWTRQIVTGRYDCERGEWESATHRRQCIMHAWLLMVKAQDKRGAVWTGDPPKVAGPLQHVDFSTDSAPDLGPGAEQPDPRDRAACDAYEASERAKASRRSDAEDWRVDFTLSAPFKKRVTGNFTARFS